MLEGSGNLYGEEMSYEDLQELGDDAELGNVCILFFIRLNANQTKFDYSNLNRSMNHSVDIIITVDDKVF